MKEKLWILHNKKNIPVACLMPLAHYIKLKEGPVNKNKMFGPRFFVHVKYETWIAFGLQKPNANDDCYAYFKP